MTTSRARVHLAAVLCGVLFTGCSGPSEPATEPPPAVDAEPVVSETDVARQETEADRLERECVPAVGVARAQVEERFGEGAPARIDKTGGAAPADSPQWAYEFCDDGVLLVRYDEEWKVLWAHFVNPYSAKGVPLGRKQPLASRANEARRRLAQMQRIRDEFRARFGE